jgi:AcrR family transcriptional regulator
MPPKKDDAPDNKRRYLSSAARKEEILDAPWSNSDRTYNAVSMERLAECAGLSKAGIYAHQQGRNFSRLARTYDEADL